MISWIQNHLIRHGRWIFIALLIVVIIAFVFTIGNMPGLAPRRDAYQERNYYGYDLNSQREMGAVTESAALSAEMDGRTLRDRQQLQSAVLNRIALLHLADRLGVPAPTQAALSAHLRTRRAFLDENGAFSPERYTAFVDRLESNPRIPRGLIVRVLEDDDRIAQVRSALTGPGYVLPDEAALQARRNATRYGIETASLDYGSFEPEIEAGEEDLRSYFERNAARYEIPERIEAACVVFATADFREGLEAPSEADLRRHFMAERKRFVEAHEAAQAEAPDAEEGGDAEEAEAVTFETVRAEVEADLLETRAMRAAHEAAQAFAYQLYRDEIARDSDAFGALLESRKLALREIPPFSARDRNVDGLPPAMLEAAFDLGGRRYYTDAYEIDGGYGVLIRKGRIEPEIPPFETVEAAVRADFEAEEKRRLFDDHGRELRRELEEKLASGTGFAESAADLGLDAESYETFARTEPPAGLNPSAIDQAERMSEGEVSPMLRTGGEGLFVHLSSKEVPETDRSSEAFTSARDFLSRFSAFVGAQSLTEELVARGIEQDEAAQ